MLKKIFHPDKTGNLELKGLIIQRRYTFKEDFSIELQLLFVDSHAFFDKKTIKLQDWLISITGSLMIKIFVKKKQ